MRHWPERLVPELQGAERGERAEHDFDRRKTLADLARRHHVKGKTYLQNSLTNQFP